MMASHYLTAALLVILLALVLGVVGCKNPDIDAEEGTITGSTGGEDTEAEAGSIEVPPPPTAIAPPPTVRAGGANSQRYQELLGELRSSTTAQECFDLAEQAFGFQDLWTAGRLYDAAYDRGMVNPTILFQLGYCWQNQDPERAIRYYDHCLRLQSDHWDAHFNRANCYFQLNRILDRPVFDETNLQFTATEGTGLKPDTPPENDAGEEEGEQVDEQQQEVIVQHGALFFFTQLLSRNPNYLMAWYNRGYCHYLAGLYNQARSDFEMFMQRGGAETELAEQARYWIDYLSGEVFFEG